MKPTPPEKKKVYLKYKQHIKDYTTNANILDICGVTTWEGDLQSLTKDLLSNDSFFITEVDLRKCNTKKKNFKFIQSDVMEVSFNEKIYDYIICSNAIQHFGMPYRKLNTKVSGIDSDQVFIQRAAKWIRSGGRIFIDTSVCDKYQILKYNNKMSWRVYTVKQLQDMLVSNGFKIIDQMYFDGAKDTKKKIPSATGYVIIGEKT